MCGRVSRSIGYKELLELFEAGELPHPDAYIGDRPGKAPQLPPIDFASLSVVQVAPTQDMLVTTRDTPGLQLMRWGFCASWFKQPDQYGRPLVNARAETATTKPTFRAAVRAGRRCLVWVSGWFEWQKTQGGKQPHHIQLPGRQPFAMAGIWERYTPPGGDPMNTVAVLTTAASADLAAIHDRMPFCLHPSAYRAWLDGQIAPQPAPTGIFEHYPVTTRVGRSDYLGSDALMPVELS
jgi:putative SOS response-associated peptidase YedK